MSYRNPQQIVDSTGATVTSALKDLTSKALTYQKTQRLKKEEEDLKKEEESKQLQKEKNKINRDLYDVDVSISDLPSAGSVGFDDKQRIILSAELDRIHELGVESIDGDNYEYLAALGKFKKRVNQLPVLMGILNTEAEMLGDAAEDDILNSGSEAVQKERALRLAFIKDIRDNDGANLTPKYENGVEVIEYINPDTGESFVLNGQSYLKAKENGGGDLINYVDRSYGEEAKKVFDKYKGKYKAKAMKFVSKTPEGKQTITKNNWEQANKDLKESLLLDEELDVMLNESIWQDLVGGSEWTDSDDQRKKLKEIFVDKIVDQNGREAIEETGYTLDETLNDSMATFNTKK